MVTSISSDKNLFTVNPLLNPFSMAVYYICICWSEFFSLQSPMIRSIPSAELSSGIFSMIMYRNGFFVLWWWKRPILLGTWYWFVTKKAMDLASSDEDTSHSFRRINPDMWKNILNPDRGQQNIHPLYANDYFFSFPTYMYIFWYPDPDNQKKTREDYHEVLFSFIAVND